jgi:hypothetical protein
MPPVTAAVSPSASKDMKRSISHQNNVNRLTPELIAEVRKQVIDMTAENSPDYDQTDIDRIEKTDEMIERFAIEHFEDHECKTSESIISIANKVSHRLCETLRWRHEFGVNNLKDSDFPSELYECGFLSHGQVEAGHQVVVMKIDRLIRLKHWSDIWVKFIVHEMEKLSTAEFSRPDFHEREKFHVISDASGAGFAQINLHFLMTIIPIFFHHYPQAVARIWLYEIPYLCMALKPIIMRTLPGYITKKVVFCDRKDIDQMGYDSLPAAYGGHPNNRLPLAKSNSTHCRSLSQVGRENNIPENEINKMSQELGNLIRKTRMEYQV